MERATPRVTVTTKGVYTIAILMITFLVLMPNKVISVIAIKNTGMVDNASQIRMITASKILKYPAKSPRMIPATVEIAAVINPTTKDSLTPYSTLENTSLP